MKKTTSATLTAACAALALTVLTGCGSSATGSTSAAATAPGPKALADHKGEVTVTLWHGLDTNSAAALDDLLARFNAAHKGRIKATAVYQGSYADALAKYTAAVRDKSTPSVLLSYDVSTGYLADAGQTVSATALNKANPGTVDTSSLRPAAAGYYSADGKLLAVPFNTSTPLLYVNTALLRKAGLPADTPLNTLAEVAAAARTVHAKLPGVKGLDQPFDGWWTEQLTAAAGQTYCTPGNGRGGKGTTALTLTAPAQKAAIKTVADLYTSGAALDTGTAGADAVKAFQAGKVAMIFGSSGAADTVTSGADFTVTAHPYPLSAPKASAGPVIGGAALWVNGPGHSSAEQVASWQLIGFLTSASAQREFAEKTGYLPINRKVDTDSSWKSFLTKNPIVKTAVTQLDGTPAVPATAGCLTGALPQIRTDVVSALQSAFSGRTPLDTALKNAQTAADNDIAQYRKQAGQ
ncbi:ABC transporter substrate-binding protein [Streptomyces sp. NPDC091280]|uniref:ABC transporter substrate-binding protein n=1 Tax=Streptomyces sp. NPDC091280 TaxID=3365984 RepID=UPI00380759C2